LQPVVNIGLFGHVDHGKTTLVKAITGKWTDTHSEEVKKGITIKLGYADASFFKCPKCHTYTTKKICPKCGTKTEFQRKISFVDAPGHESLMAIATSASAVIDGALLLIAANEKCPQEQTKEHLMLLQLLGIKNIVIVQTKLDLVTKERALKHYEEIKSFVKGTIAENAPIVPVAAHQGLNIDKVIEYIEKTIPTPKRNEGGPFKAYVVRSFDVNKPGTPIKDIVGGVIGVSIVNGKIHVGDEVELSPGIEIKEGNPTKIRFKVISLHSGNERLEEALPGGLIAIGTELDPSLTKADQLLGQIIGTPGTTPDGTKMIKVKYDLIKRTDINNPPLKEKEVLLININTMATVGVIAKLEKGKAIIGLKRHVPASKGDKVALSRRIGQRWRLSAIGIVD